MQPARSLPRPPTPVGGPETLILASRSPQRRAILEQIGAEFDVEPADVVELTDGPLPEMVIENARRKALAVAEPRSAGLVLGVDTAVVVDGRAYGKPASPDEARAFLEALSGRTHVVWSGVALLDASAEPAPGPALRSTAAATEVRFRPLGPEDIDWYLASGEWRERAGGYAIQGRGAALVEGIVGDYWNVVGLPVSELLRLEPGLIAPGH